MYHEIKSLIQRLCHELFQLDISVELSRPDEKFGDYSTNVALQLAGRLNRNPREVAEQIVSVLSSSNIDLVASATIAGPGFINIHVADSLLIDSISQPTTRKLDGQIIVTEYSDPNPFKVLHAGHLYTSIVGDSISNLLEEAGATVYRVNFGGDVGLHVGKTMWAIVDDFGGEDSTKLDQIRPDQRSDWMADMYIRGTKAYEENDTAKQEIIAYNKRIYQLHEQTDQDSEFAKIYWTCRQWSYDYFEQFYATIGSRFDKYYPESQTAPIGLKTVKQQLEQGVYKVSDGAVVFDGEEYGLHTRVFINSEGLPTYEAKDVGLIMKKWQDYKFDKSVVITGNEIDEYMKVVLKSIEQFRPELAEATTHLTHGMVKLPGGVKMSSRLGNFLRASEILDQTHQANQLQSGQDNPQVALGAVKYSLLKHRMGGDLIYDPAESVSLEGNSGPYLQYAHARACSILRKAQAASDAKISQLDQAERQLVLKISQFNEVVEQAIDELMPHHLCTYLYELTQSFNRFYESNRVIDDERQTERLLIVEVYASRLKQGLKLLGIAAPEQM